MQILFCQEKMHNALFLHKKHVAHSEIFLKPDAILTIRLATAAFDISGSLSMRPSGNTNATRFVSVPKPLPAEVTSFATTKSSLFSRHLRTASDAGSPVSAANPTRIGLRPWPRRSRNATVLSISGLRTSRSNPSISFFLSFFDAHLAGRQSATAAVATRQSKFSDSTAVSISRAETTSIRRTPCGVLSATGPATSVTSCPAARAARATAKPMRPVDGFERKRTGSMNSRVGPAVTRNFIPEP